MKTRSIIITAGGTGKRMGTAQPKQFLLLGGKPVLMHTIERLHAFSPESQLILTLPEVHRADWEALCVEHRFTIPLTVVNGGEERYHSIKQALEHCTGTVIAVHDGVRPFVSAETLTRLFEAAETQPAVIPVIALKDSIRQVEGEKSHAVSRSAFRIVQTPQVFDAAVLRKAYELPYSEAVTDDAGLVETSGIAIHLVEGNEENVKITVPSDLVLAEALLRL